MHILQRYGKMEEHDMEKRIQEATFDAEVQYCGIQMTVITTVS